MRNAASARSRSDDLSVTITLFNGASWIEETLQCVRDQVLQPHEIVVVDDGSKDDGAERARRFPGVRVVPSLRKLRARHTGLLNTSGKIVAFLDQDDLWHPNHLRVLWDALDAEPDAPAAFSSWAPFYDGTTPRLDAEEGGRWRVDPWETWPLRCPITTPSAVLFRRSELDAVGGWTTNEAPDWEIYLRLTAPATLVHVGATTCGYRLHPRARSAELRRDGFAYLDVLRRGAEASLSERLERGLDEATRNDLQRRQGVLDRLDPLMRALHQGDAAGVATAARQVEADLAGEPDEFANDVFVLLLYMFCPDESTASHQRHRSRLLHALGDVWPHDAPRTKALLDRHAYERFRWRRFFRAAMKGRFAHARRQLRDRHFP